jgi:hypothetical protein
LVVADNDQESLVKAESAFRPVDTDGTKPLVKVDGVWTSDAKIGSETDFLMSSNESAISPYTRITRSTDTRSQIIVNEQPKYLSVSPTEGSNPVTLKLIESPRQKNEVRAQTAAPERSSEQDNEVLEKN